MNTVTLITIVGSLSLVYSVVFYRISRNHTGVRGPGYWSLAALLEGLTVLVAVRPEIPVSFAIVVALFLSLTGIGFNWIGISAFLGKPVKVRALLICTVGASVVQALLVYANFNATHTMTVFFVGVFAIMVLGFRTQKEARADGTYFDFKALNVVLAIEAVFCVIALVATWMFLQNWPVSDFRAPWYQALLLVYSMDTLVRSSVYFLMVGKHLQSDFDQSQQRVLERQHRFTSLMENLSIGVLIFSKDRVVIEANTAGIELLSAAGKDPKQWKWVDENGMPMPAEQGPLFCTDATRVVFRDVLRGLRSADEQELRWGIVTAYAQTALGAPGPETVLTFLDITQHKKAQEKQIALEADLTRSQRMRTLGQLASGIAHDFNNSLMGISGWVSLAKEDLAPEHPSNEALDQALKGGRYAQSLVRQLLAFSRFEKPKLQWINLADVVTQASEFTASGLVRGTQVTWYSHLEDDSVHADPTQLQQVLVNLLINASHAMNGLGQIHIEIDDFEAPNSSAQKEYPGSHDLAPGLYRHVRIQDNGPGIAPEHLKHIFEPFFTTKKADKGTGLGLSVSHGVLTDHRGGIGVSSTPGQGACFHLYLPAASVHREAVASLPGELSAVPATFRILVAEDDDLLRKAWSTFLIRHGWSVTLAKDGREVSDLLDRTPADWDVVLADHGLPGLGGTALAERIAKSARPAPVVLISGEGPLNHLPSKPVVLVLETPIEPSELERVLTQVARRHKALKTFGSLSSPSNKF